MEAVARATPDGYTLVNLSSTNTINATMYEKLSFDFLRDIAPVAAGSLELRDGGQSVVAGHDGSGVHRIAKANPGKLSYASTGIGTPAHVSTELLS